MHITSTLHFSASCDDVASMLIDPAFAEHVGAEIQAENVTVSLIDKGMTAVFTVVAPESARRILGAHMTLTETVTWEEPDEDGSRVGRMTISLVGMPATSDGTLRLTSTTAGAWIVYDADFSVKIPLVGKKIEQMTAQYLNDLIAACEKVGNDWLSANRQP